MNILVDENIPLMTVKELRRMGHDVRDIRGTQQEGMTDSALWNLAQQEKRLLMKTDKRRFMSGLSRRWSNFLRKHGPAYWWLCVIPHKAFGVRSSAIHPGV